MATTRTCGTRNTAKITGLVAVLAGTGCATTEPYANAWKPLPPGSTYVMARHNTGSWGNGSSQVKVGVGELADGKVIPHENECRVEARGLETTQWYAPVPGLSVKVLQVRSANNPFGGAGIRDEERVSLERR